MWMMLQHDYADDFVISTGNTYSVEDYLKEAFKCINIVEYMDYVEIDESLMRPSEVPYLRGISKKAERRLGWKPKVGFKNLVSRMVQCDIQNNNVYRKDHTTT
jgi:GDPmannose 4,6-dehydratase